MWMDEAACLKTGLIFGHLLIPNSGQKDKLHTDGPLRQTW